MKYNRLKKMMVGAGRLFDFTQGYDSVLYNKYLNSDAKKLDNAALRSDWEKIGKDIRTAISKHANRQK